MHYRTHPIVLAAFCVAFVGLPGCDDMYQEQITQSPDQQPGVGQPRTPAAAPGDDPPKQTNRDANDAGRDGSTRDGSARDSSTRGGSANGGRANTTPDVGGARDGSTTAPQPSRSFVPQRIKTDGLSEAQLAAVEGVEQVLAGTQVTEITRTVTIPPRSTRVTGRIRTDGASADAWFVRRFECVVEPAADGKPAYVPGSVELTPVDVGPYTISNTRDGLMQRYLRALPDQPAEQRKQVLHELEQMAKPRATQVLMMHMHDADESIAMKAMGAVARTADDEETLAVLLATLAREERSRVRGAAKSSMGILQDKLSVLLEMLRNKSNRPTPRAAAALSLGEGHHWAAMPDLIRALNDDSRGVRVAAQRAIETIIGVGFAPPDRNSRGPLVYGVDQPPADRVKFIRGFMTYYPRFKSAHEKFLRDRDRQGGR